MEAVRSQTQTRERAFSLPYPPSVNHYWRRVGARTLISREGRRYRGEVCAALAAAGAAGEQPMAGRLSVRVVAHPPDRRRRDLDNLGKALLDAMAHGGVYEDDSQIDRLTLERGEVVRGGRVDVTIAEGSR